MGVSSLDLGRRETALLLAFLVDFQDTQKDLWLYVVYFSPDVNGLRCSGIASGHFSFYDHGLAPRRARAIFGLPRISCWSAVAFRR